MKVILKNSSLAFQSYQIDYTPLEKGDNLGYVSSGDQQGNPVFSTPSGQTVYHTDIIEVSEGDRIILYDWGLLTVSHGKRNGLRWDSVRGTSDYILQEDGTRVFTVPSGMDGIIIHYLVDESTVTCGRYPNGIAGYKVVSAS